MSSIKDEFPQVKYVARTRNIEGFQIKLNEIEKKYIVTLYLQDPKTKLIVGMMLP